MYQSNKDYVVDSSLKNHIKSHQTRNTPQKCDLICPGQQPIPLPPNFMQNCTSSSTTNNTSASSNPTTARPTRTTTTESGEEESTESNEEGTTNGTARIGKHQRARSSKYNVPNLVIKFKYIIYFRTKS